MLKTEDFSGGPMVKNLPSNAGDMSLIPSQETETLCAGGQLRPHATTRESPQSQQRPSAANNKK